jgi:hypothetical protein
MQSRQVAWAEAAMAEDYLTLGMMGNQIPAVVLALVDYRVILVARV